MLDLQSIDIRRAVTDLSPYGMGPVMMTCSQHDDDAASLAVYPDHLVCFGCEFRIQKRLDALAWLLKLPSWRDALRVAEKYQFTSERKHITTTRRKPLIQEVSIYESILQSTCSDRKSYLGGRLISDRDIATYRIGHTGSAFTIPIFNSSGELISIRYRHDPIGGIYDDNGDKIPKYFGWSGHNEVSLYPAWLPQTSDVIAICEGEFDTIVLRSHGYQAFTLTNGAGSLSQLLDLLPFVPTSLIIATDQDDAGRRAAREIMQNALTRGIHSINLEWPREWGKDITELYQKGYDLEYICYCHARSAA